MAKGSGRDNLTIVVVGVLVVLLIMVVPTACPVDHSDYPIDNVWRSTCFGNLAGISGFLHTLQTEGHDIYAEKGSAFLLQAAPKIVDHDLRGFICPGDKRRRHLRESDPSELVLLYRGDWRNAPCSYRGPDEWLLARLREDAGSEERIIIACDRNGPDGRSPHHTKGVVCMWSDFMVTLVRWDDIKGSDGGPVPVGPDSPDPRFRHLVP